MIQKTSNKSKLFVRMSKDFVQSLAQMKLPFLSTVSLDEEETLSHNRVNTEVSGTFP